jgi:hypothetical protein
VLWFARVYGHYGLARVAIPAFVVPVFASVVAWAALGSVAATRLVQVAFGLIAAGDVIINATPWSSAAAPAFIGAHLALAAAFTREREFRARDLLWLLPPAFAALAFARAESPLVNGAARSTVLAAYLFALVAMVWRALCSAEPTPKGVARAAGALLFFGTDLCAIAEIVAATSAYAAAVWAMYPPALIALAWSCWRRE